MNRYVAIFAVCSLIGLSLARAQAPAPVTVSPSSGGTLTVRNGGTITVIAFALTYDLPLPPAEAGPASAQSWQLYDAATEPLAAQPISGGQEVTVRCHFDCTATPFQLKAVLFQDGTSRGDSGWVQRTSTRRAYMEQALQTSIRDLTTALSQGTTREAHHEHARCCPDKPSAGRP
jgi:hypothetical protein